MSRLVCEALELFFASGAWGMRSVLLYYYFYILLGRGEMGGLGKLGHFSVLIFFFSNGSGNEWHSRIVASLIASLLS